MAEARKRQRKILHPIDIRILIVLMTNYNHLGALSELNDSDLQRFLPITPFFWKKFI
jgi:hypothetical protein